MADKFAAAVSEWARKTERQQTDVLHEALRNVTEELGNKTPVVSGNLKNSRTLSTLGLPTIDWKTKKFRDPEDAINNAVAGVEVGQTAWIGYRAPYAHKIEPKYAMVRLTAQLWKRIAEEAARIVRVRGR